MRGEQMIRNRRRHCIALTLTLTLQSLQQDKRNKAIIITP